MLKWYIWFQLHHFMPFFSVVIPLYNKERFIANTLKSLLLQTFSDFEVLIINDGSTDRSESIALSFDDGRIRYFSQENQGVSAARNFGISNASADHIAFLDADDYWHPTFLESMHNRMLQLPEFLVFAAAIEIETSKTVFKPQYSIAKTGEFEIVDYFEASQKESAIWTSSAAFHKSVFEKTGGFDSNIRSGEDIDLWIRIGLLYPIVFSWKIIAKYIFDAESLSKNKVYTGNTINFSKFEALEKTNPKLKKFLDLNRFSIGVKSKISGNKIAFEKYSKAIDPKNLDLKKQILLKLPAVFLRLLIWIKTVQVNLGLGSSVFK